MDQQVKVIQVYLQVYLQLVEQSHQLVGVREVITLYPMLLTLQVVLEEEQVIKVQ